jgi:hypothetical protein
MTHISKTKRSKALAAMVSEMFVEHTSGISFSPEVVVHEVLHIDDFDDDEIYACWYYEEEYRAMRQDIHYTKEMMKNCLFVDEQTHCRRGVEDKSTDKSLLSSRRRIHDANAIRAVLREQEAQRKRSREINDELISLVYQQFTQNSQLEAFLSGASDADEVHRHASRGPLKEKATTRDILDSPPTSPKRSPARKPKGNSRHVAKSTTTQLRPRLPVAFFSL